jgi:hypothetical protein
MKFTQYKSLINANCVKKDFLKKVTRLSILKNIAYCISKKPIIFWKTIWNLMLNKT